jgi:hypothetical protein
MRGRRLILLAPLVFALHVAEEAPRFVEWFSEHAPGMTPGSFWAINIFAFAVTVALTIVAWASRTSGAMTALLAWLSFLMLANGICHMGASLLERRYVPGTMTAALLYMPYFFWFARHTVREFRLAVPAAVAVVAAGSIPMLIQGYLLLFEGRRLF